MSAVGSVAESTNRRGQASVSVTSERLTCQELMSPFSNSRNPNSVSPRGASRPRRVRNKFCKTSLARFTLPQVCRIYLHPGSDRAVSSEKRDDARANGKQARTGFVMEIPGNLFSFIVLNPDKPSRPASESWS